MGMGRFLFRHLSCREIMVMNCVLYRLFIVLRGRTPPLLLGDGLYIRDSDQTVFADDERKTGLVAGPWLFIYEWVGLELLVHGRKFPAYSRVNP